MGKRSLAAAQDRAASARTRLIDSVMTLRARLSPGALVRDVKESVVAKGAEVAKSSADAVIDNKWTVAGAASLIGLFLARKPIAALLSNDDETSEAPARLTSEATLPMKEKK